MNPIARFLDWLNTTVAKAERTRREAYLSGSANRYERDGPPQARILERAARRYSSELEHRMRMLDRLDTSTMRGL